MVSAELRQRIEAHLEWYHTIEIEPGLVTPGAFDYRDVIDGLPLPDASGLRCLDVATYDGYYAVELHRRGAAEVVAIDISDHAQWDWPPRKRQAGIERLSRERAAKGLGFELVNEALGSPIKKIELSVYDLKPQVVGTFDLVTCGALLLHLRDPFRALEAIRSVTGTWFFSNESVDVGLSTLLRRTPAFRLNTNLPTPTGQWLVPNAAGFREMIRAAGFDIESDSGNYVLPFGPGYTYSNTTGLRALGKRLATSALTRSRGRAGGPHRALLTRPADL